MIPLRFAEVSEYTFTFTFTFTTQNLLLVCLVFNDHVSCQDLNGRLINMTEQHDVEEFFNILCQRLENKLKGTQHEKLLRLSSVSILFSILIVCGFLSYKCYFDAVNTLAGHCQMKFSPRIHNILIILNVKKISTQFHLKSKTNPTSKRSLQPKHNSLQFRIIQFFAKFRFVYFIIMRVFSFRHWICM
jgi:hypothetical protein